MSPSHPHHSPESPRAIVRLRTVVVEEDGVVAAVAGLLNMESFIDQGHVVNLRTWAIPGINLEYRSSAIQCR